MNKDENKIKVRWNGNTIREVIRKQEGNIDKGYNGKIERTKRETDKK